MNIALFAGKEVGYKIARLFGERKPGLLSCLVVDSNDRTGINDKIRTASRVTNEHVIGSDRLYAAETVAQLRGYNLDLGILAWWPNIIKDPILSLPREGHLNFHPSLLPYQRGKNPNFWALRDSTPFGVTLHLINAGVDTGPIAYQRAIPISWEDNAKTIYDKALEEIVSLFTENFEEIVSGNIPRVPQDPVQGCSHKGKEMTPASEINLEGNYRGRELLNLIRAATFPPFPGAWFVEDGKKYEVKVEIKKVGEENE